MRRGWYLGSEAFKASLLKRLHGNLAPHHPWARRAEVALLQRRAILPAQLRRWRWTEATLAQRAKTDFRKVPLATKLRQETTMTLAQIFHRLRMGTRNTLNAKLHQWRSTHE
jgi:hypothetical protein